MKTRMHRRIFIVALLAALLLLFPACGGETESDGASDGSSSDVVDSTESLTEETDSESLPVESESTESEVPESESESVPEETESESRPAESEAPVTPTVSVVDVRWRKGYVGSATNSGGFANKLNQTERNYAYTDVIRLGAKGTKVTFTDEQNGVTSSNAYVVSSWKWTDSGWVIDLDKPNIPGGGDLVIETRDGVTVYTYVSKYDNECIRFCFRSNGMNNKPDIYMSQTDEPPTAADFVSEGEKLAQWIAADKERAFYESLQGKTFTVIGDSYLAGNGLNQDLVWPALMANKYGMEYRNYGMNGSTMSNFVTTNNPMVDRYTGMANNDPDIIIIEGGRNDYNKSVPIGEDGSMDTKTMKGAARYLITKLQERYPNAVIICLTVWEVGGKPNSLGNYCSDYGRALMEVCTAMNLPCINAMDQKAVGVYMTDPDFRAQYCMKPTDISHLNADGMKLVFPVFEKYIADFYAAAKK